MTSESTGSASPADGPSTEDDRERRMHPAWVAARAIHEVRSLVPAFVGLAVVLKEWALPAAAVVLLVELTALVLRWRTTRYAVVDGALRLRSGVLRRSERVIPASRISALDTTRRLVQRAFGLVSLEVQTAGGGRKAELRLDAISATEADRLRVALGHAGARSAGDGAIGPAASPGDPAAYSPGAGATASAAGDPTSSTAGAGPIASTAGNPTASTAMAGPLSPPPGAGPPASRAGDPAAAARPGARPSPAPLWPSAEPDGAPVVYAITGRDLVVAALTGPQLGLVAVVVGSVLSQGQELLPERLRASVRDAVTSADAGTVVVVVVLGLLLAAALSVAGTVLAFAEFTVLRDDRRLRVRRGLLTERTGTIPLDRVHGVRIVEGLVRRQLGYATVLVEVAGYGVGDEVTRTLIPLARRHDLRHVLARVLPEIPWPTEELERPPARARRRYWTVPLLWSLVPAAAAVLWLPDAWRLVALAPPTVALALGDARWRGAGWRLDPDVLAVRRQLLSRSTLLALPRRAQDAVVRTTPFQRRADLAGFAVALATKRHGTVRHLDASTAADLQRSVAAAATRKPPPDVLRELPLDFAAAPPE